MPAHRTRTILSSILDREGGYVNRPDDRGGPTNYGITLTTLSEWRGRSVSARDVQALSVAEARSIYAARYLAPFDGITHDDLFDLTVDTAVNHGRGRATRWLQEVALVEVDGVVGPITLGAVNARPVLICYYGLCARRVQAYGELIRDNHNQAVFAAGWLARVAAFIRRPPGHQE